MAYGRIDVYWPDGPIESYRLDKPTIAVGRSTGNDIVLDTTAVSRYHITFSVKNQQVFVEDLQSVNGTYIDGVHIPANDPALLRGGEEIQIGDIRLIYHPETEAVADVSDTTQRVVLSQLTYRVEMDGPDMSVAPGAHVQAVLKIENLGEDSDRYFVELDGLPKAWVRIDRIELEVDAGDTAQVIISFKPLRRSESSPGAYPFIVRVRSKSNPAQTIDAPATLQVLPFGGFGMALGLPDAPNGSFKLYLHNQGNAPLPLALRGSDPARRLAFQLPATGVVLKPGERQTLTGAVRARRRRWAGPEQTSAFALVAESQDASGFVAAVPGRYSDAGVLPGWAPALIVPVIAIGALLVAGLVLLLLQEDEEPEPPAPQPAILSFATTTPSVVLGEIAQITWQVTDAERITIDVTGAETQQSIEAAPGDSPYALTFDRSGRFTLTLQALSGDAVASATAVVEVLPEVQLEVEVLSASDLVRYVERDVRLTWTVDGARTTETGAAITVESSDRADPLFTDPLPASGSEVLTVAPTGTEAEWLITLVAEGNDGVTSSVTQSLRIAEPSCQLSATRTVVRTGPGELYPAAVPALEASGGGTLLLRPLARDPGGEWLRVVLGVEEDARSGWVPRADLNCTNFDPARLVVDEDYPEPPAPTTPLPQTDEDAATVTPTRAPTTTPPSTNTPANQPRPATSTPVNR